MVTSVLSKPELRPLEELHGPEKAGVSPNFFIISSLTLAALFIHGFHPYAEDGGLYLAGVKRVLDPSLYEGSRPFVVAHLRYSLFAPGVAWLVQKTALPLLSVVLLLHLASIWLTLYAAWMLAGRCFTKIRERAGAVCLLAVWLTLPVAGTSLMVMDPYVTARSLSTPLTLFMLVGAIDFLNSSLHRERWSWSSLGLCVGALLAAAVVHPLMAGYGFCCVLALSTATPRTQMWRVAAAAALGTAGFAAATFLRLQAVSEPAAYRTVALSRYYWFLERWHWYELIGILAPLAILAAARAKRYGAPSAYRDLAWMGVVAGTIATTIAFFFARVNASTYFVARMQPLRVFQMIYIVMILFVGAWVTRYLKKEILRWMTTFAALIIIMIAVERATFPFSERLEFHEERSSNRWVQAFDWVRGHTPKNALFALDADYITKAGEDAQSFRAIAERSALPDYSKDGGEAAITPALTELWTTGEELQNHLSKNSDQERLRSLAPKGVGWVVLESKAQTRFVCDYANETVKVCRLPQGMRTGGTEISLRQPTSEPAQR